MKVQPQCKHCEFNEEQLLCEGRVCCCCTLACSNAGFKCLGHPKPKKNRDLNCVLQHLKIVQSAKEKSIEHQASAMDMQFAMHKITIPLSEIHTNVASLKQGDECNISPDPERSPIVIQ